jgi:hypothetical protein
MALCKEVCRACFVDFFAGMSWAETRFEKDWARGDTYCRRHMSGTYISVGGKPPDDCLYLVEQTVAEEPCRST